MSDPVDRSRPENAQRARRSETNALRYGLGWGTLGAALLVHFEPSGWLLMLGVGVVYVVIAIVQEVRNRV